MNDIIIISKNLRLSKKGVIPHLMRDLHPLIWVGDTGSGSGMTEWITLLQYSALFGQLIFTMLDLF